MKLPLLIAVAAVCASTARCALAAEDVFFAADFDSPVRLGGWVEPYAPQEGRLVEGKFGKGCFFGRTSDNRLKPEQDPGLVESPTGLVVIAKLQTEVETRWRDYFRDAAIGSAWVKGEAGDTVEVSVEMTTFNENEASLAEYEKKLFPRLKARDKTATDARIVRYEPHPQSVRLTGGWQRVAAYCFSDARLDSYRRFYTLRFRSRGGRKLAAKKFMFELRYVGPKALDDVSPGVYTPPGRTTEFPRFGRRLADYERPFPVTNGTFSAWVRTGEPCNLRERLGCYFVCGRFEAGPKEVVHDGLIGAMPAPFDGADDDWHHVAVTWSATNVVTYLDGRRKSTYKRVKFDYNPAKAELKLGGCGFIGRNPSGVTLDEVFLYGRTFSAAEVAALCVGAKKGDAGGWAAERTGCRLFHRNERAARLVYPVHAPAAAKAVFAVAVDGRAAGETKVDLVKGENLVCLPFDARALACGKHRYEVVGCERTVLGKGPERLRLADELEILPRFDRGAFSFFSWGGNNANLPVAYILSAGCDGRQLDSRVGPRTMDEMQRLGLHVALNCNSHAQDGFATGFDRDLMRAKIEADFKPHIGRFNWDRTLCTSEASHPRHMNRMKGVRRWEDWARQELGHEPVFDVVGTAQNMAWPKGWKRAPDGVYADDNPVARTFYWGLRRGEPVQVVNAIVTEAAHRLSPGNFTWSENHNGGSADGTVFWDYSHETRRILCDYRMYSGFALDTKTKWQPTIGMGTWPDVYGWLDGKKPADREVAKKTRFSLMLTVDEVKIQSYAMLGSTRCENLAYFDLDAWYEGEPHVAAPKPHTRVADPDSPARLKAAIDADIRPYAMLLRDADVAPNGGVALMMTSTAWHGCSLGWLRVYLSTLWGRFMGTIPNVDLLRDGFTAEDLAKYRHILMPGARNILKSNDAALEAAAKRGTKIWTDFICTRDYPGGERFDGLSTNCWKTLGETIKGDATNSYARVEALAKAWRPLVREGAFAWVESSDGDAIVYPRSVGGEVRFASVHNLTGTTGPQNRFTDQADFRPYGKAAKATVSLKIPKDWTVYDFMASRKLKAVRYENGRAFFDLDLPAAGCALLAAYPAPLEKLTVTLDVPKDEPEGAATVRLTDATGACPKGRQIVRATVTDAATGAVRDESGWYVLKDGACRIPLYFPTTDKARRVKVSLVEKTSGLTAFSDL